MRGDTKLFLCSINWTESFSSFRMQIDLNEIIPSTKQNQVESGQSDKKKGVKD